MTGLIEQITAFVAGHGTLAYGVIFLICAAEAFPVVQWADTPQNLAARLDRAGWSTPPAWSWRSALAWIESAPDLLALPVLPQLNAGQAPVLTLVEKTHRARLGRAA